MIPASDEGLYAMSNMPSDEGHDALKSAEEGCNEQGVSKSQVHARDGNPA